MPRPKKQTTKVEPAVKTPQDAPGHADTPGTGEDTPEREITAPAAPQAAEQAETATGDAAEEQSRAQYATIARYRAQRAAEDGRIEFEDRCVENELPRAAMSIIDLSTTGWPWPDRLAEFKPARTMSPWRRAAFAASYLIAEMERIERAEAAALVHAAS